MMRALKYAVGVLLGLPLLLVVAMLLAASFDEELSPEVVELVERTQRETIPLEGNAYFPLIGLFAPSGADFVEYGRQIYEADQRELDLIRRNLDYTPAVETEITDLLKFKGDIWSLCSIQNEYLFENGVCKNQLDTDRMFVENKELLPRYYRLIEFDILEEPAFGTRTIPAKILSLAQLAEVDIERRLANGQIEEATELLIMDLVFWRSLMVGKFRMTSQLVLQVGHGLRIRAISELLLRWPALLRSAELKTAIAESFPVEALILSAQLDREFLGLYFVRRGSDAIFGGQAVNKKGLVKTWLADHLFRKNATLNDFHACLKDFYAVRKRSGVVRVDSDETFSFFQAVGFSRLTNPVGEMVLDSACPEYGWSDELTYSDQQARSVLLMLQIELLARKLPDSAIADFLENVDSSLRDPKTGDSAIWDGKHRVIYFPRQYDFRHPELWVRLDTTGGFNSPCGKPVTPKCSD